MSVINFRVEYSYLVDLLRHNCLSDTKFWMGYKGEEKIETVFGKPAYWRLKWQKKSRASGKCVTYRDGAFERGNCGGEFSFICENHNYNDVCQPRPKPVVDDSYIVRYENVFFSF